MSIDFIGKAVIECILQCVKPESIKLWMRKLLFGYIPIEESIKIFYNKTGKFPKDVSKCFQFNGEHNTNTTEEYIINVFLEEGFQLYGKDTNGGKFDKIPLNELKEMKLQKIKISNKYGFYIDGEIKEQNLQYTEISIKKRDLSKTIEKWKDIKKEINLGCSLKYP